ANGSRQKISIGPITIPAPGYVYIYLDDNSNSPNWVYFDDLKVTHVQSPFVAGGDFYPFGLTMDDRQMTRESYRYGYQGQYAEKDATTGWNEFRLRMFEPRYGRWLSADPRGQYQSPFVGMGNNPGCGVDPTGGSALFPNISISNIEKLSDMLLLHRSGFEVGTLLDGITVTPNPSWSENALRVASYIGRSVASGFVNTGNSLFMGFKDTGYFANGANNAITGGVIELQATENWNQSGLQTAGQAFGAGLGFTFSNGSLSVNNAAPVLATNKGPIRSTPSSLKVVKATDVHGKLFISKGNTRKISEEELRLNGYDAHSLKKEFFGTKAQISNYDVYINTNTKELWIYRKGGGGYGIQTGYFLK
ncbi:MAG: hypothetical protein JST14_17755, partial [Bacteroidetes bacterium]|nr:hypothetical protein [Bacteroidota bacterium]